MSKKRKARILQPSDEKVFEAVLIALAQKGHHFHRRKVSFKGIEGKKKSGMVTVTMYDSIADVYVEGDLNRDFSYVDRVVFRRICGRECTPPEVVQIQDFARIPREGENENYHLSLTSFLNFDGQYRMIMLYMAIGCEDNGYYGIAQSVLEYTWEYPEIRVEGNYVILTYEETQICGYEKIELWYHWNFGCEKAVINTTTVYRDWVSGIWTKEAPSEID